MAGGRLVFATGHPGAMLLYYLDLARWAKELGGEVLTARPRGRHEKGISLDWAGSVGTLGDGASLFHTHGPEPMREVLQELGEVDLVIADHGFAGAAIAADLPTVTVMDTNDPAFAVVADTRRGRDDSAHRRQPSAERLRCGPRGAQGRRLTPAGAQS